MNLVYFLMYIYAQNNYEISLRLERLEVLDDTDIFALNGGGNFLFLDSHIRNANSQKSPLFIAKIIILT